jgi:hypothetical protein
MKITCNFATFPARKNQCLKMLESIKRQFDEVNCYFNNVFERPEWMPEWVNVVCGGDNDLTDIGKFYFLEPEMEAIYFTCDDDIHYPPTYVSDMLKGINDYGCIVAHHGRVLNNEGKDYYLSHKVIRCLSENKEVIKLDVAGTGVTAFDTRYFNPYWIKYSVDRKMSDLTFSLEVVKHDKQIVSMPHPNGYFKNLEPPIETTIHKQMIKNQKTLIEVMKKILHEKNRVTSNVE